MIRKIVFTLLWLTSIPFFIREILQKKKVTILFNHEIDIDTANRYFRCLKSNYNIISLREFVNAKKTGTVNKLPPKSLVITFDDGYKSNFELVSLFDKYQIPSTFFICSGIVGTNRHFWFKHFKTIKSSKLKKIPNRLRLSFLKNRGFDERKDFKVRQSFSEAEIIAMKNIVDFQSHTEFHPILPECTFKESNCEIANSKKVLESSFDLNIYALCYPNGDYSEREISLAKRNGYECCLTTDLGFNSQSTDIFRLKRISAGSGKMSTYES